MAQGAMQMNQFVVKVIENEVYGKGNSWEAFGYLC